MVRKSWAIVAVMMMAMTFPAYTAQPKAGDVCKDKDAFAMGVDGHLLRCFVDEPKWRFHACRHARH